MAGPLTPQQEAKARAIALAAPLPRAATARLLRRLLLEGGDRR